MIKAYSTLSIGIVFLLFLNGCGSGASSPLNNSVYGVNSAKRLYIVSGSCYGGGVTVSVGPAQTVAKFNLGTGLLEKVVIDYNSVAPGDSPVSIYEYDANNILVLVENTGGRRIDLVRKDGSGYSTYLTNATALSAILRSMVMLSDFSLLVSKSSAIEKFNAAKSRVTVGANPYVNAPAGACATSTTLISSVNVHSSGKIVMTHAAATPNNKIASISAAGYAAGGDCLSGVAGPATTALPTQALFHSSGKLLVSFGSTTLGSNFIYSYDFNGTSGVISNPLVSYNNSSIVNGPSKMVEDTETGDVYVANVTSTFNTVEKFTYSSGVLTRVNGNTFIPSGIYTRCIADMGIMP